jgi:hypothetical protein
MIIFDYPCSETFYEYFEERQGKQFPSLALNIKPLNDEDMKDPKVLRALETLKIISNAEELISYLNEPDEPEAKPIKKETKKPEVTRGIPL